MRFRTILYGGIGVAALYGAYRLGHRQQAQLGLTLPFTPEATKLNTLSRAAGVQVGKALQGILLSDYRSAEDIGLFWGAATTAEEAYFKGAYWLALASRATGARQLAAEATGMIGKGSALMATPGSSLIGADPRAIYADVARQLTPYTTNVQVKAILALLGHTVKEGVSTQQKAVDDTRVAAGAVAKTGQDAVDILSYLKGMVSGEKPPGADPWKFWAVKWGGRVLVGVAALLALRAVAAPYLTAAKATVARVTGGAASAGQLLQNGSKAVQKLIGVGK